MSQKQGSSPKLKHANQPRKAPVAKAGRRSGSGQHKRKDYVVRQDQTYTFGRSADLLQQRSDAISEILQWTMHSPSATIDRALKSAMEVYLRCFADIKWRSGQHPRDRHAAAVMVAVNGMNESLSRYAKTQFRIAFTKTGPQY